jgi:hypothetical protein
MAKQKLEMECPVCDAKMSIDARSCPKCGADLGMADIQDLEDLANDISNGSYPKEKPGKGSEPITSKPEDQQDSGNKNEEALSKKPGSVSEERPVSPKESTEEKKAEEEPNDKGKKKGLFSKFFGKKK